MVVTSELFIIALIFCLFWTMFIESFVVDDVICSWWRNLLLMTQFVVDDVICCWCCPPRFICYFIFSTPHVIPLTNKNGNGSKRLICARIFDVVVISDVKWLMNNVHGIRYITMLKPESTIPRQRFRSLSTTLPDVNGAKSSFKLPFNIFAYNPEEDDEQDVDIIKENKTYKENMWVVGLTLSEIIRILLCVVGGGGAAHFKKLINGGVKINGRRGLQISKQLSNHMKGCQNKRNKEKICNVTKTRYQTFWKCI